MDSDKRCLRASADEEHDPYIYLGSNDRYDDDQQEYHPRYEHKGRKLRRKDIPYKYNITDDMVFETLYYKYPIGNLKPPMSRGEDVEFSNARYAGGYAWHEPMMRDQLAIDHKAPKERVFTTPGT